MLRKFFATRVWLNEYYYNHVEVVRMTFEHQSWKMCERVRVKPIFCFWILASRAKACLFGWVILGIFFISFFTSEFGSFSRFIKYTTSGEKARQLLLLNYAGFSSFYDPGCYAPATIGLHTPQSRINRTPREYRAPSEFWTIFSESINICWQLE